MVERGYQYVETGFHTIRQAMARLLLTYGNRFSHGAIARMPRENRVPSAKLGIVALQTEVRTPDEKLIPALAGRPIQVTQNRDFRSGENLAQRVGTEFLREIAPVE